MRSRHGEYLQTLPSEWRPAPVRSIGEVVSGSTPSRAVPSNWNGDIPWVAPGELTSLRSKYLTETRDHLTRAGLAGCSSGLLPVDTLLVTTRATIGVRALAGVQVATNQGFKSIVLNGEADPHFYYHLFDQLPGELVRLASGTTFLEISGREFKEILVPRPARTEQRRIAAILDTLDAAIRRTEQVIAKLQHMKQGLLHDLLTRGVDENGDLRDPVRTPEAFVETELGVLPRHWELGGFSMFRCSDRELIKTGPFGTAMTGRQWADTGVPVITIGSLGERGLIQENLLFLAANDAKAFSSYELRAGDLVFSRVADIGRSLVIRAAEAGWIMSSNLMRISLDHARVVPDYVHLAIVYADSSRRQIRCLANAGAREVVNTAILTQLKFAWPPGAEQRRICRVVEGHDAEVATELQVLGKLRLLKRGLLHDLLTGRVRVPLPPEVTT